MPNGMVRSCLFFVLIRGIRWPFPRLPAPRKGAMFSLPMNRLILRTALCWSLALSAALAQAPLPPPKSPTGPLLPPFARENQLIDTGGFEMPHVKGRVPKDDPQGNFIKFAQGEWIQFAENESAKKAKMSAGLTNEIARTGMQSIYVSFDHVKERLAAIFLSSELIQVKPKSPYHVSIWGRIDRKKPITLDGRVPILKVEIEFFQEDRETQTGETIVRVQPVPGTPNRPLLFSSERWSEYYVDVTPPEDGVYVKVTWYWSTTSDDGETNGVAFFDDATIEGEKVEIEPLPEPTEEKPPGTPAAPGAPAAPVPGAPAPGAAGSK
jgi:hypothetical protein